MAGTHTVARIAWIVLGAVGVVMVISMFFPQYRKYIELQEQVDAIEAEYRTNEERLQQLKTQQDKMRDDPEFVERLAREELGLAKPGETVIKFVGEAQKRPATDAD